jgi:hypothetical protein
LPSFYDKKLVEKLRKTYAPDTPEYALLDDFLRLFEEYSKTLAVLRLAERVRAAQRDYYKTRSHQDLQRAKAFENDFDKRLTALLRPVIDDTQHRLF